MNTVHVDAVGLVGPGLTSWQDAARLIAADSSYQGGECPQCRPELLPANERRRVTSTGRLALKVAEEAMTQSSFPMDGMCSVFATCNGDSETIDRICLALTEPDRPVSPTQFHNSVHNAAAGYWAIAAHSPMPSTTVSAYQASFVAGLMEACAQVQVEARPVLLVAYDHPAPAPLDVCVGVYPPFAVAMVLSGNATARSSRLHFETVSGKPAAAMRCAELERLRVSNPAAASLPLLRALASDDGGGVVLAHVNGLQLAIEVESP